MISLKTIKCPFCEWEWKEPIESAYSEGLVIIIRGNKKHLKQNHIWEKSNSSKRNIVDVRCPKCKRTIEFDLGQNEVIS